MAINQIQAQMDGLEIGEATPKTDKKRKEKLIDAESLVDSINSSLKSKPINSHLSAMAVKSLIEVLEQELQLDSLSYYTNPTRPEGGP